MRPEYLNPLRRNLCAPDAHVSKRSGGPRSVVAAHGAPRDATERVPPSGRNSPLQFRHLVAAIGSVRLWVWLCIVSALWAVGCGKDKPPVATDKQKIVGIVSALSDAWRNPDSFERLFVDGAAPDAKLRPRFGQYSFELKSTSVEGERIIATVIAREVQTGNAVGELQWTLVREGDQYKLQSAPLPGG